MRPLGLVCVLLFAVSLQATDRHVAMTGNDATLDGPYRTIARALSVRQPGDRIVVHAGTYPLPHGAAIIGTIEMVPFGAEAVTLQFPDGTTVPLDQRLVVWTNTPPAPTPDVQIVLKPGGKITRAQWTFRTNPLGLAYCYVDKGTTVEVVK